MLMYGFVLATSGSLLLLECTMRCQRYARVVRYQENHAALGRVHIMGHVSNVKVTVQIGGQEWDAAFKRNDIKNVTKEAMEAIELDVLIGCHPLQENWMTINYPEHSLAISEKAQKSAEYAAVLLSGEEQERFK
eukprot:TRINITY_DN32643_c0_g1_i1.p2 TRINITY_DN32643_c0_g1~~TRINITY_DN32643_c0_g1_i1.p2  ORF type:complete len:134 (+),score=1.31 TRINITY_DN32643_c0_g1_i1:240-641(+)